MDALLNLSLDLQIIFAAGYLGFWVATVGIESKLRPTDIAMQILVYGLVAKLMLIALPERIYCNEVLPPILAVIASVVVGMCWRSFLRKIVTDFLKFARVHNHDHMPTVLDSIMNETNVTWEYVQVHMKDGRLFESDSYKVDNNVPLDKYVIDPEGNIAMYVTKIFQANRNEEPSTFEDDDENLGSVLSYISADNISRIDICWKK